jgi:phage gp36-like protein
MNYTFLQPQDMPSAIYGYQIYQITQGDDAILLQALHTAIEEVSSYLGQNSRKEYQDGRPHYDVAQIFNQTGQARNPLILEHCKVIALWWLIKLCNADVIYEQAKERYDRSIDYLKQLSKGYVSLTSLPTIIPSPSDDKNPEKTPFKMGSRKKFKHE